MRTAIISGSAGFWAQRAPPQFEQNAFLKPSGGSHDLTSSSPAVIRNEPGATRAEHAAPLPVRRWQRVQWQ